jgi:hypothetical protein
MKTEKDFPPPGMRTMHIMSEKIGIWGDAYGVSLSGVSAELYLRLSELSISFTRSQLIWNTANHGL